MVAEIAIENPIEQKYIDSRSIVPKVLEGLKILTKLNFSLTEKQSSDTLILG